MKYVRVKFTENEYKTIIKLADVSGAIVSNWVYSKVIQRKKDKELEQFYFFNRMIYLLEIISNDIKKNKYHENNSKVFFYLYLIEQNLSNKL